MTHDNQWLKPFYAGLIGMIMGITLSMSGLTDYGEIHSLFILQNLQLILVFGGAIGLSMVGFFLLKRNRPITKKPFTKGTIPGSILFGVGWALSGACPATALVMLGEGKLAALATTLGILAGVWVYRMGTRSVFQFDAGVCGEE